LCSRSRQIKEDSYETPGHLPFELGDADSPPDNIFSGRMPA
jgi:hypothetical protein